MAPNTYLVVHLLKLVSVWNPVKVKMELETCSGLSKGPDGRSGGPGLDRGPPVGDHWCNLFNQNIQKGSRNRLLVGS